MRHRLMTALASAVLLLLLGPTASQADHVKTSATVSATVTEQSAPDYWRVLIRWSAACEGPDPGTAWYGGELYMVDIETEERHYVGGVVNTSGSGSVTGRREWAVASLRRPQHLLPELTVGCYQNFPLHGGPDVTVSGDPVTIPPIFGGPGGGGGGGGGGGPGGGGGGGDPYGGRGCRAAIIGTSQPDVLSGGAAAEIIVGFAARDRLLGRDGNDCLIGGTGPDRLDGGRGLDRLTGGSGADTLVDRHGPGALDAGSGSDFVNARNGARDRIRCGTGRDRARVDRRDRVRGCERVGRR